MSGSNKEVWTRVLFSDQLSLAAAFTIISPWHVVLQMKPVVDKLKELINTVKIG